MKSELDKLIRMDFPERAGVSQLFSDLRAEVGGTADIGWMLLYEDHPLTVSPITKLLYAKIIILSTAGRRMVEHDKSQILALCSTRDADAALILRAISLAASYYDSDSGRSKNSKPPEME